MNGAAFNCGQGSPLWGVWFGQRPESSREANHVSIQGRGGYLSRQKEKLVHMPGSGSLRGVFEDRQCCEWERGQ